MEEEKPLLSFEVLKTPCCLFSLSYFKHSFFKFCTSSMSKICQLTFQTCLGVALLSITVNIRFAFILLHYHCGVMQFKRRMIRFETSALHYLILIMWLWQGIRPDLMLTVMDYTPQASSVPQKTVVLKRKWLKIKAEMHQGLQNAAECLLSNRTKWKQFRPMGSNMASVAVTAENWGKSTLLAF